MTERIWVRIVYFRFFLIFEYVYFRLFDFRVFCFSWTIKHDDVVADDGDDDDADDDGDDDDDYE